MQIYLMQQILYGNTFATVCRMPLLDSAAVVALSAAVFEALPFPSRSRPFAASVRWFVSVMVSMALVVVGIGHSAHASLGSSFQLQAVVTALDDGDTDGSAADTALATNCHCACVAWGVPLLLPALALDSRATVPSNTPLRLHSVLLRAEAPPPRLLT